MSLAPPRAAPLLTLALLMLSTPGLAPPARADPGSWVDYDGSPFANETATYSLPAFSGVGSTDPGYALTHVVASSLSRDQRLALVGVPTGGVGIPPPAPPPQPGLLDVGHVSFADLAAESGSSPATFDSSMGPPAGSGSGSGAVGASFTGGNVASSGLPLPPVPLLATSLDYEICWQTTGASRCTNALLTAPTPVDLDGNGVSDVVVTGTSCGADCFQISTLRNPAGSTAAALLSAAYDTNSDPSLTEAVQVGFDTRPGGGHVPDSFTGTATFASRDPYWAANASVSVASGTAAYVYVSSFDRLSGSARVERQDANLTWGATPPTQATASLSVDNTFARRTDFQASLAASAGLTVDYSKRSVGAAKEEVRRVAGASFPATLTLAANASASGQTDFTWTGSAASPGAIFTASGVASGVSQAGFSFGMGPAAKAVAIHRTPCALSATADAPTGVVFQAGLPGTLTTPQPHFVVSKVASGVDQTSINLASLSSFLGALDCPGAGPAAYLSWTQGAASSDLYALLQQGTLAAEVDAASSGADQVPRAANVSWRNADAAQSMTLAGATGPIGTLLACSTHAGTCPQPDVTTDFARMSDLGGVLASTARLHGAKGYAFSRTATDVTYSATSDPAVARAVRVSHQTDADGATLNLSASPASVLVTMSATSHYNVSTSDALADLSLWSTFGATTNAARLTSLAAGTSAHLSLAHDLATLGSTQPIGEALVCLTTHGSACGTLTRDTALVLGDGDVSMHLLDAAAARFGAAQGVLVLDLAAANAHDVTALDLTASATQELDVCAMPGEAHANYTGLSEQRLLTWHASDATSCLDAFTIVGGSQTQHAHADFVPSSFLVRQDLSAQGRAMFVDGNGDASSLRVKSLDPAQTWAVHVSCFTGVTNASMSWSPDIATFSLDSPSWTLGEARVALASGDGGTACPDPEESDHATYRDSPYAQFTFQATAFRHAAAQLTLDATSIDLARDSPMGVSADWRRGATYAHLEAPGAPGNAHLATDNARGTSWSASDDGADFVVTAILPTTQYDAIVTGAPSTYAFQLAPDGLSFTTSGSGLLTTLQTTSILPVAPFSFGARGSALGPLSLNWSADGRFGGLSALALGTLQFAADLNGAGVATPTTLGVTVAHDAGRSYVAGNLFCSKSASWGFAGDHVAASVRGCATDGSQRFVAQSFDAGAYASVNLTSLPTDLVSVTSDAQRSASVTSARSTPWANVTRVSDSGFFFAALGGTTDASLALDLAAGSVSFATGSSARSALGYWEAPAGSTLGATGVRYLAAGVGSLASGLTTPIDPTTGSYAVNVGHAQVGRFLLWSSTSGCFDAPAVDHVVLATGCGSADLHVAVGNVAALSLSTGAGRATLGLQASRGAAFELVSGPLSVATAAAPGVLSTTLATGRAGSFSWSGNESAGAIVATSGAGPALRVQSGAGATRVGSDWTLATAGALDLLSQGSTTTACAQAASDASNPEVSACLTVADASASTGWDLANPGSLDLDTSGGWATLSEDVRLGPAGSPTGAMELSGQLRATGFHATWDFWSSFPTGPAGHLSLGAGSAVCVVGPAAACERA